MKYRRDGLVQNSEDIHDPQRMNPTYVGDPRDVFPPAGLFFKFFRMDENFVQIHGPLNDF